MRLDVARDLAGAQGLPADALFTTLYRSPAWSDLEVGRGDREAWLADAHARLERLAGRALPPLHTEWRRQQAPIAENVALIGALRPPYRVGILSNNDLTLRSRLADGLGIIDLFDDVVCSAEVGCAKPGREIYRLAAERIGVSPAGCVFVDDSEANVRAAEAAGMRAVYYRIERGDDLRAQLAALGVSPP